MIDPKSPEGRALLDILGFHGIRDVLKFIAAYCGPGSAEIASDVKAIVDKIPERDGAIRGLFT